MPSIIYPKVNPAPEEIEKYIELAKENIEAAEILFKEEKYRGTVSRAYYAFFDAASALLLTEGLVAKSHAGLLTLFGLHFVKTGKIEAKFARLFTKAKEAREEADYEIYKECTKEKAKQMIKTAREFVNIVEEKIKRT